MGGRILPAAVVATLLLPAAHADAAPDSTPGAPEAQPRDETRLQVVAAGSAPFVDEHEGRLTGPSVEIWARVATRIGVTYDFHRVPSVAEALDQVARGEAAVAIGPISITAARSREVAFTQPYFQSSLGILAQSSRSGLGRIAPFLTRAFLTGLVVLFLVLAAVGAAIWLAERKRNPEQFPARAAPGIANGVWLALVTMTTVGYGDRVPTTGLGRVMAGVWMLVSIIVTSSLVAFIASALTLSQLQRPAISSASDLRGTRVAVVEHTPGARFAADHGARTIGFVGLDRAIDALAHGKVDAVVFDRPMLRYYMSEHPELDLQVAEAGYQPQGYGFALPHGAKLLSEINVALLGLAESGVVHELTEQWFGPS